MPKRLPHRSKRPDGAGPSNQRDQDNLDLSVGEPAELLPFLLEALASKGRNSVKSMLKRGQISVDGKSVTAHNHPLRPGQTVSVNRGRVVETPPLVGLDILHEDDSLLVVNKAAGLLSIASEQEQELTAYRQLTAYVRAARPDARIFIVHRLDRDTSGVMMFAKSEAVQQAMQNQWKEVVLERSYTALVEGKVRQPEGTIESWLKENKSLRMYSSPHPLDGAKQAITHYRLIRSAGQYSLLEVRLETGRKNQIRVHLQDIGHPVAGDKKYGARTNPIRRLGLHASVLAFLHPVTGETLRFDTDIPRIFLKVFEDART